MRLPASTAAGRPPCGLLAWSFLAEEMGAGRPGKTIQPVTARSGSSDVYHPLTDIQVLNNLDSMSLKMLTNPLALAVLALCFERPMHPYEMAATLKRRRKHESIKLRYGSLYTVIELMTSRGLIRSKETSRDGKRPERTVYALTPAGRDLLRSWMRHLLAEPAKEFPQFEAALCFLPVLPPDEALALLRDRVSRLQENLQHMRAELQDILGKALAEVAGADEELPAPLLGLKFPAIFVVENEYRLTFVKAELDFVTELVRRITEQGWGPASLWRDMQASCEREYQRGNDATTQETASAAGSSMEVG
jgi:DNA-binding PadR family transcriptional regulator